jgi:hypothetical protein
MANDEIGTGLNHEGALFITLTTHEEYERTAA